jgi:hypothetical protein
MSRYSGSLSEHRYSCYPIASQESFSLPGDEYHNLRRAQDRERLESHFEHRGDSSLLYKPLRSAYRDIGLSYDHRRDISEVRSATRAALGPTFIFDDDSYERSSHRYKSENQRSSGWTDDAPSGGAIPKKYLDEFNQRWHEDDEDNDADQYLADYAPKAAWRKHEQLDRHLAYIEPSYSQYRTSKGPRRIDSGYGSADNGDEDECVQCRPHLSSKFSFDDLEEPKRKHAYLNCLRYR